MRELLALGVTHLCIQPSVPLQHLPLDAAAEPRLDPTLRARLGFAVQKLGELAAVRAVAESGG